MKYYTHQPKVLIIVIIVLIVVKLTRYGCYAFIINNIRDRPFNLKGGAMVFCFVQKFCFGQNKLEYFFLSHEARIFFPEFNIRLYDKNSQSDFFFFLHQNQNIFFSNIGNQNIFLEKNHNPPSS